MVEEDDRYKKAQAHVRKIKGFYSNLITFFLVNILLLVINLLSNRHHLWFWWVTLIWGAILIVQAFNIFTLRNRFLSDEWEEKKIRELMEKDKKDNNHK
jgi:Na+/melibiose symporter-like transporter